MTKEEKLKRITAKLEAAASKLQKKAGTKKDVRTLRDTLMQIEDSLQNVISEAKTAINQASQIGGEIERVVGGQLKSYMIGHVRDFIDNENQPGSIAALTDFLADPDNYELDDEEENP